MRSAVIAQPGRGQVVERFERGLFSRRHAVKELHQFTILGWGALMNALWKTRRLLGEFFCGMGALIVSAASGWSHGWVRSQAVNGCSSFVASGKKIYFQKLESNERLAAYPLCQLRFFAFHPPQETFMTIRIAIPLACLFTLAACAPMANKLMTPYSQSTLPVAVQVPSGHVVAMETVGAGSITYECKTKKTWPVNTSGCSWDQTPS